MKLVCAGLIFLAHICSASEVRGSELEIRLLQRVGSNVSKTGDPIQAVVITPVMEGKSVVIPPGAIVSGFVGRSDRLGLGLRHKAARLDLKFTHIRLPGGEPVAISAQVASIEEARETVDSRGAVIGIHPSASLSTGMSVLFSLSFIGEPELRLPIVFLKYLMARAPDAEISFPAGTDLFLRLKDDSQIAALPRVETTAPMLGMRDTAETEKVLTSLPEQMTRNGKHPSDLVNIALIGNREAIEEAFQAAGWDISERRGVMALYHVYRGIAQRIGYRMAAMANLKLDGRLCDLSFHKSLDTFSKRHHILLWRYGQSDLWLGAATEDVQYEVRAMHLSHATDPHIDNERAKVVNDLSFTGCVEQGALVQRLNLQTVVDGGKPTVTDGHVAVLALNSCIEPRSVSQDKKGPTPARIVRVARAIAEDTVRSNPISVLYSIGRTAISSRDQSAKQAQAAPSRYGRAVDLRVAKTNVYETPALSASKGW